VVSRLIAALLLSLSIASAPAVAVAAPSDLGATPAATAPPSTTPGESPSTTALDNEFIPEDVNLSECVSAVPRPECGSKARGGWRQGVVLAAVVAGMGAIGARIVLGLRKRAGHRAG
jgi:hypothetical protein